MRRDVLPPLRLGVLALTALLGACSSALAQSGATAVLVLPEASVSTEQVNATQARATVAERVARGASTAEAAITQLRGRNASGLGASVDVETDHATALIDVGRRLLAARRAAEAETLFVAAEAALTKALALRANQGAAPRVRLLRKRAAIRADYLGQAKAARLDLDAALALAPGDPDLRYARSLLFTATEAAARFNAANQP